MEGPRLRLRHSRASPSSAWPGPDRRMAWARTRCCAPCGRLSRPSRWSGRRPEQRATVGQTVDQTVDSAVDSRLSRWITRTFLWISQILRKILRFLARKPCASSPSGVQIHLPPERKSFRGETPGTPGKPGRQESRVTGISVAASRLGGGPQSARKPGNRRPSARHPGEAPPTHTRRGLIRLPGPRLRPRPDAAGRERRPVRRRPLRPDPDDGNQPAPPPPAPPPPPPAIPAAPP